MNKEREKNMTDITFNPTEDITPEMVDTDDGVARLAKEAVAWFKEQGWKVLAEDITHNIKAWRDDYKSGCVNREMNYFLFTPCGCNPFRVNLTSYEGGDWQTTYEA